MSAQITPLTAINRLCTLFYQRPRGSVAKLRKQSRDLNYVWGEYVQGSPQPYAALWQAWHVKFNVGSRALLLNYCIDQEGTDYPVEHMIAASALCDFFYNYTADEIAELRGQSTVVDYVWGEYIEGQSNTFGLIWELWHEKFDYAVQHVLLEHAIAKYGPWQRQQLEGAMRFRALVKAAQER